MLLLSGVSTWPCCLHDHRLNCIHNAVLRDSNTCAVHLTVLDVDSVVRVLPTGRPYKDGFLGCTAGMQSSNNGFTPGTLEYSAPEVLLGRFCSGKVGNDTLLPPEHALLSCS